MKFPNTLTISYTVIILLFSRQVPAQLFNEFPSI